MRLAKPGGFAHLLEPMAKPPLFDPAREAALNDVLTHYRAKRFEEAERAAEALVRRNPKDGDARNLLGGVALERGAYAKAVEHLDIAAKLMPNQPFVQHNAGEAHRRAGALVKALAKYRKAIALKPDFAEAHAQAGEAYRALGQTRDAHLAYQAALKINPKLITALNGAGALAMQEDDPAAAAAYFQRALEAAPAKDPGRGALVVNLAQAWMQSGALDEAQAALFDALSAAPEDARVRRQAAASLRHAKRAPDHPRTGEALLALMQSADVNPRLIATAAADFLRRQYALDDPALLQDDLFLALLTRAPIPDAEFEIRLRALRRDALLGADAPLAFLCALARQCFLNEYVYALEADEAAALDALAPKDWRGWALYACYRPLSRAPEPPPREGAPDCFAPLPREQIDEPAEERAIADTLTALKPLANETSLAVQAMYEESPYPRWTSYSLAEPVAAGEAVRQALPQLDRALIPQRAAPDILIAGCGTGLETMRVLTAYRDARVTGIDLSRASLAYGARKLREYGLRAELIHGDILDLDLLGRQFDMVHSFGVIHHMREPERGLASLARRLKPGGLMRVGLYSEIGRASVVAARALIAERGYGGDLDAVRRARADMMREKNPALAPLMSPASDFWTASDCRDLIFHVEEHRYTMLQIGAMLAAENLQFLGLELINPGDRALFASECGGGETDPAIWHAFETRHPEIFGDTYRIWARKPA